MPAVTKKPSSTQLPVVSVVEDASKAFSSRWLRSGRWRTEDELVDL